MKPTRLLIALAVLLGLGGAVWYSEKHPPEPKSDFKTEKIISVEQDQVKKIHVTRPGGERVTVEKSDDGKWKITQPKEYKADESSVSSMVSNLATLNADSLVAEKNTDWKTYGLDPGRMHVEMTLKDGKTFKLALGDEAPTSSAVYARLDGSDKLYTIGSWVKTSLDKGPSDLRDKRLLPFDSEKTSRVTIRRKDDTLEFGKAGNNWQIVKPRPIRADNFSVDDLVRSVRDANFESILDEGEKPPAKYTFTSPYAVFEAVDAAGVHTLTIAKDKDGSYYCKTTAMPGVFKIGASVAEGLNKKLDDLRNKKLFDFGWSDPQKLEVRDGDVRMVIEKQKDKDNKDKWVRTDAGNKELPSDKVQSLIDNLRNLSAKAFPSDESAAQAKYGLDKPVAEAKVTSDEGKRVERVLIAGSGEKYFAARENEPSTYEIEKTAYEDFKKAVEALK